MRKGFTIIEAMIILTILGVLVVVAVPAYQKYAKRVEKEESGQIALQRMVVATVQAKEITPAGPCLVTSVGKLYFPDLPVNLDVFNSVVIGETYELTYHNYDGYSGKERVVVDSISELGTEPDNPSTYMKVIDR